jgi:chaperonin cofactor prefoldin
MGKYLLNKETQKIELHFDKAVYMALSDEQKKEVNSAFLWSGKAGAWVSRSIHNHYRAVQVAQKLGLENEGSTGERLSYAEELERKSEKAEARAERMEEHAANAEKRAENLQKEFNSYHGDIAFFTQPNINSSRGRAFTNYRNKVYTRFEKGFEEYRKSEYFKDRAETARATAENSKLKDKVYLHNRFKECNGNIKKIQSHIAAYEQNIYKLQQGETLKAWNGNLLTIEGQENGLQSQLEKMEYEIDKLAFFQNCMDELGGVQYSKDNIKPGFIVNIRHSGRRCEILSAGPVNVTYKILDGGAAGMVLTDPYAAIIEIVQAKEKTADLENPFKVNDILTKNRPADGSIYNAYQVIKTTKTGVKLQQIAVENGLPIPDKFTGEAAKQKKVTKSKYSDFVGVYDDNWQLHKYEPKAI